MTFWSVNQTRKRNLVDVQLDVRFHICLLLWQLFRSFFDRAVSVTMSLKHPGKFLCLCPCVLMCSANAPLFMAFEKNVIPSKAWL